METKRSVGRPALGKVVFKRRVDPWLVAVLDGVIAGGAPKIAVVEDSAVVADLRKQLAMWKQCGEQLQAKVDRLEAEAANRADGNSDNCPQLQFEVGNLRNRVTYLENTYLS